MKFVDLKREYRLKKEAIDGAIQEVLDGTQFIMGPQIGELEKLLADYVGVAHCVSCGSGTEALQVALMALDVGPGDEVITVPFTWISTAEAVRLVGAEPVFVDIDGSFNLDVSLLEAAITPKTKAIMPVSLFGQMPDYEAINAIAKKHGLAVIEDGAQSFGATQNGRRSCGVTTIGTTSFFPAKPFGCYGDGGALFTDDDQLVSRMRAVRNHGGEVRDHHPHLGMNSRFDTIQAAILLAKWPGFAGEIARRQELAGRYSAALDECCVLPTVAPGNTHIYAQYTIRSPNRDEVKAALAAHEIPSMIYYQKCLHEQPVFANLGYGPGSFPEAEKAAIEVLSLPLHPWLEDAELDRVIEVVQSVARREPVAV